MKWTSLAPITCTALLYVAGAPAQTASPYETGPQTRDGIGKYYHQREIAHIMGFEAASWLDRPERASEERPDVLLRELHLAAGMTVADIGAGSGYLSVRIAPLVAPGKVLAEDVQPEMVALLKNQAAKPGFGNIVPVLGKPDSVELPPASVDVALLVDVYHELVFPFEVVSSIVTSLKPGGRLVFVEYRGEDLQVPIKPVHKMTLKQLLLEMQSYPVVLERSDEQLPIQHMVIFRKA